MSCPQISIIQSNECIGNSLSVINDNFAALSEGICDNINTITEMANDITNLTTQLNALSGAVIPGAAKAWVCFDATKDTTGTVTTLGNRLILNSYNISSVLKYNPTLAAGLFELTFTVPFTNSNYGVIGTCSEKASIGGNYVWVQPSTRDLTSVQIYIRSINESDTADPNFVSVIIL